MIDSEEESVAFPAILYDGEHETNVGSIKIHDKLDFKQFQTTLKETIGISYNNLTSYLVDSDKSKIPSERRKILITGKINFSVLVRERNCYFLVVLKRSRRDRRRKVHKQSRFEYAFAPSVSNEFFMYMRQKQLELIYREVLSVYNSYDRIDDCKMKNDYWNQLYPPPGVDDAYSTVEGGGSRALCKDCNEAEEGKKAAFHFCIYDEVVEGGFRSTAGPICRPGEICFRHRSLF